MFRAGSGRRVGRHPIAPRGIMICTLFVTRGPNIVGGFIMKVGVFTPLLSSLPLDDVLKKLKSLDIDMVEFGTGNYPGDAHCKLSMLDDPGELAPLKSKIADAGLPISALSCHGNALHPDQKQAANY